MRANIFIKTSKISVKIPVGSYESASFVWKYSKLLTSAAEESEDQNQLTRLYFGIIPLCVGELLRDLETFRYVVLSFIVCSRDLGVVSHLSKCHFGHATHIKN